MIELLVLSLALHDTCQSEALVEEELQAELASLKTNGENLASATNLPAKELPPIHISVHYDGLRYHAKYTIKSGIPKAIRGEFTCHDTLHAVVLSLALALESEFNDPNTSPKNSLLASDLSLSLGLMPGIVSSLSPYLGLSYRHTFSFAPHVFFGLSALYAPPQESRLSRFALSLVSASPHVCVDIKTKDKSLFSFLPCLSLFIGARSVHPRLDPSANAESTLWLAPELSTLAKIELSSRFFVNLGTGFLLPLTSQKIKTDQTDVRTFSPSSFAFHLKAEGGISF